jgi:hypothetical protein
LSGVNYFIFCEVKIFDEISQNGALANLTVVLGLIIGGTASIWLLGLMGRKTGIMSGMIGQIAAFTGVIIMSITEWYGLLYPACVLYAISFQLGCGASISLMVETIPS